MSGKGSSKSDLYLKNKRNAKLIILIFKKKPINSDIEIYIQILQARVQ